MVNLTEEELGYLAGFMDGEGCFYITPAPTYKVHVRCSNTYKPIIDRLQELFGGSVTEDVKRKPHHKQCYSWGVVARDAEKVCKTLLPYLKEKKERALACILIRQFNTQGKRPSKEILEEKERLYVKYKQK